MRQVTNFIPPLIYVMISSALLIGLMAIYRWLDQPDNDNWIVGMAALTLGLVLGVAVLVAFGSWIGDTPSSNGPLNAFGVIFMVLACAGCLVSFVYSIAMVGLVIDKF